MCGFKMENVLFTYPNCNKCSEVKNYLNKKNIGYKEINAGIGDGKIEFKNFYSKNKEQIKREDGKGILLPILYHDNKIVQGIENILSNF
jgi:glutaredoxin